MSPDSEVDLINNLFGLDTPSDKAKVLKKSRTTKETPKSYSRADANAMSWLLDQDDSQQPFLSPSKPDSGAQDDKDEFLQALQQGEKMEGKFSHVTKPRPFKDRIKSDDKGKWRVQDPQDVYQDVFSGTQGPPTASIPQAAMPRRRDPAT